MHVLAFVRQDRQGLTPSPAYVDVVGDVDGSATPPAEATIDTTWIATWNEGCDDIGWVVADNRIHNDGNVYWSVNDTFDGLANIRGNAAILGHHDLCWVIADGYDNPRGEASRPPMEQVHPAPEGAIVLNGTGAGFSTILQSFPWSDMRNPNGTGSPVPGETLLFKFLQCALWGMNPWLRDSTGRSPGTAGTTAASARPVPSTSLAS